MREDILFHLCTKEEFKNHKTSNSYDPPVLEETDLIPCVSGPNVKEVANRLYEGQNRIFLLVIDVSTLRPQVKYIKDKETEEKFPYIKGPLNLDAIIDKIEIESEDDGTFEVSFSSFS